jgi:DNA-binding NtrC family response regulator
LTPEAVQALEHYDWTGNVRELRNMIERSVLLGNGTLLDLEHLGIDPLAQTMPAGPAPAPPSFQELAPEGIDLPSLLQSIEKAYMDKALDLASGNATKAAKLLNMSRDKFRYRTQKK